MADKKEEIIKLENINLWYDRGKLSEVMALKNINLEIYKGEYIAFFGPSGCGKTTLLYVLAGIEKPTEGSVYVNGKDIAKFSRQELAIYRQVGVGIVFQQFNLIPSITVLDNVALPMSFLGVSQERRRKEAARLLERLAIPNLADRYPHELSGGQQQRVGIARALANNAPIIVADEPLGNLDSENAKNVLAFLKELKEKDNRTIIMVTHEAWSLRDCERIFYMKDGGITKAEEPRSQTSIAKSLSSHFYKELYPELQPSELAAKSLSHLFLRGYSVDEIKRFEFFLDNRFKDKIDAETFKAVLDRPYKSGGLGLWRQKAVKITELTEEIIKERSIIDKIYKDLEANPSAPLEARVEKIRRWLLQEYKGRIDELQRIRLDEIISERIRNNITPIHFRKILSLSKKQFGIGVSFRATQKISEKLETILKGEKAYEELMAGA